MNQSDMVVLLKNYKMDKSRLLMIEKQLQAGNEAVHPAREVDAGQLEKLEKLESELSRLQYRTDAVETGLKLAGDFDERYRIILEARYFNNVRIEDIADMTHMSRSRCYELCKAAIDYVARILFGEEQLQNAM